MALSPVRLRWPWVALHIPSMCIVYATYLAAGASTGWIVMHGGIPMLSYIPNIIVVAAMAFVVCLAYCGIVQYSRYQKHAKEHAGDEDGSKSKALANKFAWMPYLFIPALFIVAITAISLVIGDIAASRGYISGAEEVTFAVISLAFVIYVFASKYLISHLGDAVYFDTIEDRFCQTAAESVDDDEEITKLIAAYRSKKK